MFTTCYPEGIWGGRSACGSQKLGLLSPEPSWHGAELMPYQQGSDRNRLNWRSQIAPTVQPEGWGTRAAAGAVVIRNLCWQTPLTSLSPHTPPVSLCSFFSNSHPLPFLHSQLMGPSYCMEKTGALGCSHLTTALPVSGQDPWVCVLALSLLLHQFPPLPLSF